MRIHSALIADSFDGDGWRLDLSGVFPEWWNVDEIPGLVTIPLVVVGALARDDLEAGHAPLTIDAFDGDNAHLGRIAEGQCQITRTDEWVANAPMWQREVLPLSVQVTRVGMIIFEVASNEGAPFRVPLALRLAPG